MKALVVTKEHKALLQDIPKPILTPYDALVKIDACGICSTTDRELIKGSQPANSHYPCVLGHESVGTVIEVGQKVKKFKVGDRVTRAAAIAPGEYVDGMGSAWGGYAEYGIVRDGNSAREDKAEGVNVDDYFNDRMCVVRQTNITNDQAIIAVSLAETASWTWCLPHPGGKDVIVAGAGIMGMAIALWWKMAGAKNVIVLDKVDSKLDLAKKICADHVINVDTADVDKEIKAITGPDGADMFADAVGFVDPVKIAKPLVKADAVLGVYGAAPKHDADMVKTDPGTISMPKAGANEHLAYDWVCTMIDRGHINVDDFLTHHYSLEQHDQAFQDIADGKVLKAIINIA